MAMNTEVYVDVSVAGGGAATSTQSAGAGANTAYSGGSVDWSNPGNITSSDNSYATAVFMFAGTPTKYLEATNFGFSIPAGATIDGIECFIERKYGTAAVRDTKVYIRNGDGSAGVGSTNKADTGSDWPSSDGTATYGSSSDAWGETWTVAKINSSDFGVVLACQLTGFSMTGGAAYVDHISIKVYYTTASGDTGDGSSGDPYNSLRYAFSQEGAPSGGHTRYNVKGSTYLDPSNDNGSLAVPANTSKTITIAPYSSSAADTRGPLYISGSGHQIWNQNTNDHISFVDCHFFDYGTSYAFDLDNYICCIRCIFDPSGVAPACDWDTDGLFHNCHFKKVTGRVNSRAENIWDFNTVDWIADSTSGYNDSAMKGQVFFQNRIFCSGSLDEVIDTSTYGGFLHNNTIKMSRGSQDDCGMMVQSNCEAEFNHIEGGQTAINNYGRGGLVQNNSFYDNTGDIFTRSTAINLASGNATYSQSLTATAVAGVEFVTNGGSGLNFTPSTELINLYNQSSKSQDWAGSGTGINQQWGAVLNYPASTDGLSYSKEMRTVD